jgi:hypothetical protein
MSVATINVPRLAATRSGARPAPPGFDARLEPVIDKVHAQLRLTLDDGMLLYETSDIWTVCGLADSVRRRLHGDLA